MSELVTIANVVTIVRMVLIPVFVLFVVYQNLAAALGIWVIAGVSDLLDGMLARRLNQTTSIGVILDPMADKLLLVTAFVVLSLRTFDFEPIPFWLTAVIISRDVFIVVGALMIFIRTGFRGFRPSLPGKINTLVQLGLITVFLTVQLLGTLKGVLPPLYILAFMMAIFSGIHYIFHATWLLNDQTTAN